MKKHIKLFFAIIFLILFCKTNYAQVTEGQSFEEYKKAEQERYKNYQESETKAFEEYQLEEQKGIEKLRKEIEDYWGKENFKISSKKDWVEYSNDKKTRTDVDFEKGTAKVEVLIEPEQANNQDYIKEKIKSTVENLVTTKGKTKDYSTKIEKPEELSETPVLKDQLKTKEGEIVTSENAKKFAEDITKNKEIKKEVVKGQDGKERLKVYINIALVPNHLRIRAKKFENYINEKAERFDLPVELVYAIIHTESYYNPKARSHVPAYGLMQIVPKYAGRDAYNFIYHQDKMLPANYLYKPENNIELGTAYFKILLTRNLKKITDKNKRILCAIAAYNTGAGNLSKAFTGNTNIYKSIPMINKLSYSELFDYLKKNLPYDETKQYIVKVTNRMKMYEQWKK